MHGSARRDFALLALLVLAMQLPFADQALSIDGGSFVDQAEQILDAPLAPYSFTIHLTEPRDFFAYFANPPGQAYFLALVIAVFGRSEVALHLATTGFVLAAAFAMYGLAREVVGRGLLGAALLVATPAFALSAHSVMAEPAVVALTLVAVLLFVQGVDRPDASRLVLAGLAAGLAAWFKYSAIALLPLMLLYPWLRRSFRPVTLAAPGVAALVFGAWCVGSQLVYGEIHPLRSLLFESGGRPLGDRALQLVAVVSGLGAATVFPPVLAAGCVAGSFRLSRVAGWTTAAAALAAFALALPAHPFDALDYDAPDRALGGLFLAAGVAALSHAVQCAARAARALDERPGDRDAARTLLCVAWLGAFVLLDARLAFASPKYLVPAVAPLVLLLLGTLPATRAAVARAPVWQRATAVASTLALALAVASVHASQANAHRFAVEEWAPAVARGRPVWFTGHWTVRYYAERAGHRYLPAVLGADGSPADGDVVLVVLDAAHHAAPAEIAPRLREIDRRTTPAVVPLRLASFALRAGYWAHVQGVLPFVLSSEPVSTAVAYRVAAADAR